MSDQQSARYPGRPYYNLENHAEHASALGQIAASWALVEHQLCTLFILLLRTPPQRGHAAYYSIVSNNARVDMIRAIVKDATIANGDREKINVLLDQARTAAGKRNGYIHKLWFLEKGHVYSAEGLPSNFPRGNKRRVCPTEMLDAVGQILTAAHDLGEFLIDFSKRHPIQVPDAYAHPSLLEKS